MFPWNLFPFDKDTQAKMKQLKPDEINQYVQQVMGKVFHSPLSQNMDPHNLLKHFQVFSQTQADAPGPESAVQYSVFETHDHIFVRIELESEDWLKRLKLSQTSHLLLLENIPENGQKHSIPLPSLVMKKGTTACYKEKTLEVKIPKAIDPHYSEINVTDI